MHPRTDHTDTELFARIARGDELAFRIIFHRYNTKLFPFLKNLLHSESDAKEIIQETFLKTWLQRETLPEIANPGGWLHTVASNAAYNYLRSQARYERRLKLIGALPDAGPDLHEELDAKSTQALIAEAVRQLPPRRREVFRLSRLEGLSRQEIASQLGVSENTVRNQLVEAVEFVQLYLRQHGGLYIPAILILLSGH